MVGEVLEANWRQTEERGGEMDKLSLECGFIEMTVGKW